MVQCAYAVRDRRHERGWVQNKAAGQKAVIRFASSPSEVPQDRRVTSKLAQVLAEFLHQFLANALQYLILTRHPLLKQRRSRPLYSAPSQPGYRIWTRSRQSTPHHLERRPS